MNNSVIFIRKPIGSEEFLKQIIKALGIIIYIRPKERPRKRKIKIYIKIEYIPIKLINSFMT